MDWENKPERARYLTALYALAAIFDKEFSTDKAKAYFAPLADLAIEDVETAMARAARDATADGWFPRPGDLRGYVQASAKARAEIEAGKVWEALGRYSEYSDVAFDDPVTSAVVQYGFGGWRTLCRTARDGAQTWFQRDFVRRYLDFQESGVKYAAVHRGIAGPFGKSPVALVGDPAKARALLASAGQPQAIGGGRA